MREDDSSSWLFSCAQLAATAAPVARLAYEMMLRFSTSVVAAGRAGKDSGTAAATDAGLLLMTDVADALHQLGYTKHSSSSSSSSAHIGSAVAEQAAAVARSDAVYKLRLLLLACDVRLRRKEQRGKSQVQALARDAGVARLAVPDYHTGEAAAKQQQEQQQQHRQLTLVAQQLQIEQLQQAMAQHVDLLGGTCSQLYRPLFCRACGNTSGAASQACKDEPM
jgi:hypothetical protein